jgi:hypothetical protein
MTPYQKYQQARPYRVQLKETLKQGFRNFCLSVFGLAAVLTVMVAVGYTWEVVEPHIPDMPDFEKRICCC